MTRRFIFYCILFGIITNKIIQVVLQGVSKTQLQGAARVKGYKKNSEKLFCGTSLLGLVALCFNIAKPLFDMIITL